jgi:hypothetical protein
MLCSALEIAEVCSTEQGQMYARAEDGIEAIRFGGASRRLVSPDLDRKYIAHSLDLR